MVHRTEAATYTWTIDCQLDQTDQADQADQADRSKHPINGDAHSDRNSINNPKWP